MYSLLALAVISVISLFIFVLAYKKQIRLETELKEARNTASNLSSELKEAQISIERLESELKRTQSSAENRAKHIGRLESRAASLKQFARGWEWKYFAQSWLVRGLKRDLASQKRQIASLIEELSRRY